MLTATNARVYVLRWWWWFRPRACVLVPAFLLLLIALQTIAAYIHYATTPHDDALPPLASEPATASASAAASPLSPVNEFDPQRGVAFAIAVGGRTERSKQLDGILSVLLEGGGPVKAQQSSGCLLPPLPLPLPPSLPLLTAAALASVLCSAAWQHLRVRGRAVSCGRSG